HQPRTHHPFRCFVVDGVWVNQQTLHHAALAPVVELVAVVTSQVVFLGGVAAESERCRQVVVALAIKPKFSHYFSPSTSLLASCHSSSSNISRIQRFFISNLANRYESMVLRATMSITCTAESWPMRWR